MPNGLTTKIPFRPLVVTSQYRVAEFPDVPTLFELGYDISLGGYQAGTYQSFAMAKGTDPVATEFITNMFDKYNRYISLTYTTLHHAALLNDEP
jgi:tripartite-type tricarboxylate transporter receptor subunit TctC